MPTMKTKQQLLEEYNQLLEERAALSEEQDTKWDRALNLRHELFEPLLEQVLYRDKSSSTLVVITDVALYKENGNAVYSGIVYYISANTAAHNNTVDSFTLEMYKRYFDETELAKYYERIDTSTITGPHAVIQLHHLVANFIEENKCDLGIS
jgi:hypothetical protein